MNHVATIERRSVTQDMAHRFGMMPEAFEQTLRGTVGLAKATREEFAAFLLVCKEYDLNPITKEIYAFPARGGGIVPIVSIDGWLKLINSHPEFDGMDFEDIHDSEGKLIAVKCTMFRKDRRHPTVVTEYLSECRRATEPWKMEHRMLRHKATIQGARYTFGFAGVYDPDEGEKIAEAMAQRANTKSPPAPPQIATQPMQSIAPEHVREPERAVRTPPNPHAQAKAAQVAQPPAPKLHADSIISQFEAALHECRTAENCNEAYDDLITPISDKLSDAEHDEIDNLLRERVIALEPIEGGP